MKDLLPSRFKVEYLLFLIPLTLAFLSWLLFPALSNWVIINVFAHAVPIQSAGPVWAGLISFFYSWYTLVAIGVSGTFVVAAYLSRRKPVKTQCSFNPLVSFVIPAFNQEKNIFNCIDSLFKCTEKFDGLCEIIVVDDGSTDCTYEVAKSAVKLGKASHPHIGGKVFRHAANLGKIEALRTGMNRAMGGLVAIVDADSEWAPETLAWLVDYKLANGKKAVTGYAHPNGQGSEGNLIVTLQRLEYSQSLGIGRCAQSLGDNVLVVSGVIGLYDAGLLSEILMGHNIQSVTEDLEITLEMHRRGAKVGYVSFARSSTVAPTKLSALWHQRMRWFTGWLYNTLGIHRELLTKRSWLSVLLWYCYIFEFAGAFIDLAAVASFAFLWLFAPDQWFFGLNLLVFIPYGLLIGVVNQAIALKFAYGSYTYGGLLFYTPLYALLRLINVFARSGSVVNYLMGNHGKWHVDEQ
jgi:cellulose synthase/poly-beta-1,6-N-acetylglucosamine synthase-like glycosyltransferase